MARPEHIAQFASTVLFVGSSFALALTPLEILSSDRLRDIDGLLMRTPSSLSDVPLALALPQLYLRPESIVIWILLIALWGMLMLDAAGQLIDPIPHRMDGRVRPVWPPLCLALLTGAAWPWLVGDTFLPAAVGAMAMVGGAVIAAWRARDMPRPAIGFLAGWATAVSGAALAALVAQWLHLSLAQAAVLAILPVAVVGLLVHSRISHSIAYPLAMIAAFCGLTVVTMGANPMIALAAIIGIAAMAIALVRSAS